MLEAAQARDLALRLLGRREHSARELKAKLQQRGLADQAAESAVDGLGEQGWQSDARYAELLVRSRIGQGYGRLRIEAEARVAGIAQAEIRAALDAAQTDWDELLHRVWSRRFAALPEGPAEAQKQFRYLAGRGFEPARIARLLRHDPGD